MRVLQFSLCVCIATLAATATAQDAALGETLVCDIRDHGGVAGDGLADTTALQGAIDACAGTGGFVTVPEGDWSTGTVRLGSHMTLRLDQGAVLALHPDIELFPEVEIARDNGTTTVRAAFLADGVTGLRIEGGGQIEGNGEAFWDEDFYNSGLRRPTLPRPGPVIELANCSDTHVDGVTLTNMPAYAIRFHRCDGVSARDVIIRNDPRSPNTDGIQIRDSSNVVISSVDIRTGDDAVVLKSGERVVDNVLVENSYLESDDAAVKFGTGSRVGVTNSRFRNLDIANSRYGIALFMIDGGAHRSNLFENIRITTDGRHERQFPVFIDIDRREADRELGKVVDTTFRNMLITTSGASLLAGNPDAPIEGLAFENVGVRVVEPFDVTSRSAKPRGNINIEAQSGSVDYSTENATFVFAHVSGLDMTNVWVADDASGREDFVAVDVTPLDAVPAD